MKTKVDLTSYDNIAETYIEHIENELSWNNLYERPYMLSQFDNFSNKNVLDLGCGTGFYSFYAKEKNASITAVDASQKMLDYIEKNDTTKSIKLLKIDLAEGLSTIEDASQDYIICSLVLHYIKDWENIITACYRTLKPGGKLYISTHHPFNDYLSLNKESYFDKSFIEETWGKKRKPFKVNFYTRSPTDLLKPFIDSAFNIINIEEPQPSEICKEQDVKTYQRLQNQPAFLFLTLEK